MRIIWIKCDYFINLYVSDTENLLQMRDSNVINICCIKVNEIINVSMRQKFVGAMIIATQEYYALELAEAREYKAVLDGMESSPAAGAQEQQDR